ncbi:hypothetical protein LTS15_010052 [Exophiala xenobiotica]|nr:hypothetical protein LTS15_010052 [Exophiala xenobiotica]
MYEEAPFKHVYRRDPTGHKQIRDYPHMLEVLNHVFGSAPVWTDAAQAATIFVGARSFTMTRPCAISILISTTWRSSPPERLFDPYYANLHYRPLKPSTILKICIRYAVNGQQQPADNAILSIFRAAIARPGETYIVLDALDECTDREHLLTSIREFNGTNPSGLHMLTTSRREKDIEDELSAVANHNINIQSAIMDEDIRIYICDGMATDTKLKKWPVPIQNEIMTTLIAKSGGM